MADFNEADFQAWYAQLAATRGLPTDPESGDYDYRAYYGSLDTAGRQAALAAPAETALPAAFMSDDNPDRYSFSAPGHEGTLWDTKLNQAATGPISSSMTETQAIETLLGFSPQDFFLIVRSLDEETVRQFWADAYQHLRNVTDPQDTPAKRADFNKGLAWIQSLKEEATRLRQSSPSGRFATAANTVSNTIQRLEETIRSNTLIRVGVLEFDERTIQPTDIRISETYANEQIETLRSETEVSRRKPQSMTAITLDFTFSGHAMINDLMRPLIAQLRAIPCLTLESAFLTNALINHYATPEIEAQIVDRVVGAASADFRQQLDTLSEQALSTFDSVRDILKNDDLTLEYMRQRVLRRREELGDSTGAKEKISGDALPIPASVSAPDQLLDFGIAIPVVVTGLAVTTDPNAPNTLHMKVSFLRYSPSVFGPRGLEFRDKNGAPTLDIGQCPWVRKYFEWAYLNPTANRHYFLAKYDPPLTDKPDLECTWDDIMDRRPEYRRQFPSVDAPADFVVEEVQASLGFALAPIPIVGSKYPTVHVMGQSAVTGRLTLATTSPKVVRAFHLMKDHVDAVARNVGGLFRDEAITIKNAVLNVLGGRDFIITNVITEPYPETSNGYRIVVSLAQSKYARDTKFQLTLEQGGIPRDLLRSFWDFLYTLYTKYREQSLNGSITDPRLDRMVSLVFGSTTQRLGAAVMNTSVLLAAMSRLFHQDRPEWFLNSGVEEMYEVLKRDPNRITTEFFQISETSAESRADVSKPERRLVTVESLTSTDDWGQATITQREVVVEGDALSVRNGARAQVAREAIQTAVLETLKTGVEQPIYDGVISYLIRSPWASFIEMTKPLWDKILDVIMDIADPPRSVNKEKDLWERKYIDSAMVGLSDLFTSGQIDAFGDFPGLQQYLNSDDRKLMATDGRKQFESNYPDLVLPTYAEIFGDERVSLRNGETKPLWEVFAPTFSQLGATPPYSAASFNDLEGSLSTSPKKVDDTVEPGFFYWSGTIKREMVNAIRQTVETRGQTYSLSPKDNVDAKAMANSKDAIGRKKSVLRVSINTENEAFNNLTDAARETTLWQHLKIEARHNRLAEKVVTNKADKKVYEIINSDGALLGLVVPDKDGVRGGDFKIRAVKGKKLEVGNPFLRGAVFDRHSEDHNLALVQNSIANLKDNAQSPVRHYPAFRVFFVEWDNNAGRESVARGNIASKVHLIDDMYTTNAILSIHVTTSKDDAPVAVLRILNADGEFDRDVFIDEETAKQQGLAPDDEREDYLRRMKLQSGTGIVIKMGYTSNPNDLDTVFTGQIAEVEPGQILTVTAQGYKTELFQNVSIYHPNGNAVTALHKVLTEFPLPHLGRRFDVRDLSPEEQRKYTGGSVADNTPGMTQAFRQLFGGFVTTAARNIYFESNYDIHTTAGEIFKDIGESLNMAADKYWLFDRVTQWDAVQNICRHYPGLIADVRPYETEATLFMGYPEQPYQYRRPSPREAIEYQKVLRQVVPKSMQKIADELLTQFWASDYGTDKPRTDMALASTISYLVGGGVLSVWREGSAAERAVRVSMGGALESWYPAYSVIEAAPSNLAAAMPKSSQGGGIGKNLANAVVLGATGAQNFQGDWDAIRNFHTELPTLLTCYFFGLDYNNDLVKSSISSAIARDFRAMMGPLLRGFTGSNSGGTFGTYRVNPEREYLWFIGELPGFLWGTNWEKKNYYTDAGTTLEKYNNDETNPIGTKWKDLRRTFGANITVQGAGRIKHADDNKTFGKILYENFHRFRLFIHYFNLFLQNQEFSKPKRDLVRDALDQIARTKLPPGYKSFRDYHVVMGNRDIIENKIVVTTREMANTVLIRAPNKNVKIDEVAEGGGDEVKVISHDQGWVYFPDRHGVPFSPHIPSGQRKLYVAEEPNANMPWSQANCLVSRMAESIRPMYRGWIKIIGRHVQPWDIITINDSYSQMFGPIEVDQVTHEFTRETGWITTIEPHALVSCNSVAAKYLSSFWQDLTMWFLDDGLDWLSYIAAGLAIIGTGGAAAPGAGAMLAARKFGKNIAKRGAREALRRLARTSGRMIARAATRRASWSGLISAVGKAGMRVGMIQLAQKTLTPIASALFNINLKMETASGYWPVDVQPLVCKGDPLTAGLEPAEDDVFSFGDQASGLWKELRKTMRDFVSKPSSEPTPGEGQVPNINGTPTGAGG